MTDRAIRRKEIMGWIREATAVMQTVIAAKNKKLKLDQTVDPQFQAMPFGSDCVSFTVTFTGSNAPNMDSLLQTLYRNVHWPIQRPGYVSVRHGDGAGMFDVILIW